MQALILPVSATEQNWIYLSEQNWTVLPDLFCGLKTVFREDVGPLWCLRRGRAGDHSEASWLLDNDDLLGFSGRDLPAATQEADLSSFLDDPGVVGRQMQVEEFRWRGWTPAGAFLRQAFLDGLEWRELGGA